MTNLKLNTPIKLNQIEECEWCGEQADFEYKISNNDGLSFFCKNCIKAAEELNKNILKEKIEEIEEEKQRDAIFELMVSVREEIEELLNETCDFYRKIQSSMSSSIYFEFEVDGVDKKIRVSDHDARHTYNLINGCADYEVAVGYDSAEANFIVKSEEDIKILIEKLVKKFF